MKKYDSALRYLFRDQYGVVARSQVRAAGVSASMERDRIGAGEWDRPARGVVRLVGAPVSEEQRLMVALLGAGPAAVVSHQSAAWLWGLLPAPARHAVTVPRNADGHVPGADVHRLTDFPTQVSWTKRFPCTNPLRTLVDLAGVVPSDQLDEAVDRALARKLVTVEGLEAEMERLSRPGRKGVRPFRRALRRRGLVVPPHPSVLESRALRLLAQGGIIPVAVEVVTGEDGRFRLDSMLVPGVAMEVDGHRYHSTPEQKAADERRRNEIRLSGTFLLVYDWYAVTREGRRVLTECWRAIAASRRPPRPLRLPVGPGPSRSEGSPARRRG